MKKKNVVFMNCLYKILFREKYALRNSLHQTYLLSKPLENAFPLFSKLYDRYIVHLLLQRELCLLSKVWEVVVSGVHVLKP